MNKSGGRKSWYSQPLLRFKDDFCLNERQGKNLLCDDLSLFCDESGLGYDEMQGLFQDGKLLFKSFPVGVANRNALLADHDAIFTNRVNLIQPNDP